MSDSIKQESRSSLAVLLLIASFYPSFASTQSTDALSNCPVTLPSQSPVADAPPSDGSNLVHDWYGSARLAALLPKDGIWVGMGPERNYRDKFWWWRSGYNAFQDPQPNLIISATRLDRSAPEVTVDNATNAFGGGRHSMLVMMEFPEAGCWEVRAKYNDTEDLVFVLRVGAKAEE